MSEKTTRNRRIRKKLYLDEFAILGFEFSCKLAVASEEEYEQFFNNFAELVNSNHLYITLDNDSEIFEGSVTSADRYGNAVEEDRAAIESLLTSNAIVSDVKVGPLVDAFYGM
ncbi:YggL family protein [Alteromonadaceae bacterium BrNp21-10]|nr:YggL family protein [Alteromonadaceae bacterium BrNp21-10]